MSTRVTAAERALPARKTRFIVADDSAEQRWLVSELLRRLGFETAEAGDGRELFWALERYQRSAPLASVVVLADVHMPVYGGLDVLEAWNQRDWPHAFIVMSGFPDDAITRRARALGATLLAKPFTSDDLTRLVRRLTR